MDEHSDREFSQRFTSEQVSLRGHSSSVGSVCGRIGRATGELRRIVAEDVTFQVRQN